MTIHLLLKDLQKQILLPYTDLKPTLFLWETELPHHCDEMDVWLIDESFLNQTGHLNQVDGCFIVLTQELNHSSKLPNISIKIFTADPEWVVYYLIDYADTCQRLAKKRKTIDRLQKTLESTPDAIVIVDKVGIIQFVNSQSESLFGYSSAEMVGQPIEILIPDSVRGHHPQLRTDYIHSPHARPMSSGRDLVGKRKDGRLLSIEVSLSPIHTEDGLLIASAIRDVSSRKIVEEELRAAKIQADQANLAKSEFLASMSHELRTPLNAILGYAQILMRDKLLSQQQQDQLAIMYSSGNHLLTLINDILDLSKIESGRMKIHFSPINLKEFIHSVSDVFSLRAKEKGLQFMVEETTEIPVVIQSDEKKLRQVLYNLLSNAIKYTESGGVAFKIGMNQDALRFEVSDTGIGISEDKLEELFIPFHQLEAHKFSEGTGLGLAISQQLVTMLGGNIFVKSEIEKGSIFWFELIVETGDILVNQEKKSEANFIGYHGEKKKILVVDDKWENRSILTNLLKSLDFIIMEATDGFDAIHKYQLFLPDLILMDIRMPGMDGLEVTKKIREMKTGKSVKIIAVSASVFDHNRSISFSAGCDDFIAKPFHIPNILQIIGNHLHIKWILDDSSMTEIKPSSADSFIQLSVTELSKWKQLATDGDIIGLTDELDLQIKNKNISSEVEDQFRKWLRQFETEKIVDYLNTISN